MILAGSTFLSYLRSLLSLLSLLPPSPSPPPPPPPPLLLLLECMCACVSYDRASHTHTQRKAVYGGSKGAAARTRASMARVRLFDPHSLSHLLPLLLSSFLTVPFLSLVSRFSHSHSHCVCRRNCCFSISHRMLSLATGSRQSSTRSDPGLTMARAWPA